MVERKSGRLGIAPELARHNPMNAHQLMPISQPALSFQSIFGYCLGRLVCRLQRAVLARRSPDLVPSLAVPTDRAILEPLSLRPGKTKWVGLHSPRRSVVGKKLYVGNLTYAVNDSMLEQLFSQFGTVQSAQVIQDRATGRSKGFGFVEMDTEAQAQAAIEGLHDQEHDGRRLTVNQAKPREDRGGGGGGYGGGGGGVAAVVAAVTAAVVATAVAVAGGVIDRALTHGVAVVGENR